MTSCSIKSYKAVILCVQQALLFINIESTTLKWIRGNAKSIASLTTFISNSQRVFDIHFLISTGDNFRSIHLPFIHNKTKRILHSYPYFTIRNFADISIWVKLNEIVIKRNYHKHLHGNGYKNWQVVKTSLQSVYRYLISETKLAQGLFCSM